MFLKLHNLTPEKLLHVMQQEVQEHIEQGCNIEDLVFIGRVLNVQGLPDGSDALRETTENVEQPT